MSQKQYKIVVKMKILPNFIKRLYTFKNSTNFLYSDASRYYGSTVMRGEQLSKIAEKVLKRKTYFTSVDYKYVNCTLYLTKWAVYSLSPEKLQKLKDRQNLIIFDMVDGEIPDEKKQFADVFVAASETIYKKYKRLLPKSSIIFLIDHHADPRIKNLNWSRKPKSLQVGYFGEMINTYITPKINKIVNFIPVSTVNQSDEWFYELPKYNLHYAIRQKRDVYPNKPFLKGFTAAHCNANILIQDSEKEAIKWLGKDYPYLLKGKVTENKVLRMLNHIKESYGSDEWKRGLSVMRRIKKRTSEEIIGKQIIQMWNYLENI